MIDRRLFFGGLGMLGLSALASCSSGSDALVSLDVGVQNTSREPSLAALKKEGSLGDKFLGSAEAPVSIIEYVSLTCPYSRKFHLVTFPRLKQDYIERGKVKLIIREFPIGRSAAAAAVVTRGAADKHYFGLHEKFLVQQSEWVSQDVRPDAIYKIAKQIGMSREKFDSILADQKMIDGLIEVKRRGREFGVAGTPTFFINGKKVRGALTYDEITKIIETQLNRQA